MNKAEKNFWNEVLQRIRVKIPEEIYNDVFESTQVKVEKPEKIKIIAKNNKNRRDIEVLYMSLVKRTIVDVAREFGDQPLINRETFQLLVSTKSNRKKSRMEPNIEKLRKLQENKGWSEVTFAKKLDIDYSFLYRVLRGDRGIGPTFVGNLMKLCEEEGLDFKEYVIL